MAAYLCESCCAVLQVYEGMTLCTCEYCGTTQRIKVPGREIAGDHTVWQTESADELYRKGYTFLEKGDFRNAAVMADKIRKTHPEFVKGELLGLMANFRVDKPEKLGQLEKNISSAAEYERIMSANDETIKNQVRGYFLNAAALYANAVLEKSDSIGEHKKVIALLEKNPQIKDAPQLAEELREHLLLLKDAKDKQEYIERELLQLNRVPEKGDKQSEIHKTLERIRSYCASQLSQSPYLPLIVEIIPSKNPLSYADGCTFKVFADGLSGAFVYDSRHIFHFMMCRRSTAKLQIRHYSYSDPECSRDDDDPQQATVTFVENRLAVLSIHLKAFGHKCNIEYY